ncbi:MAG: 1-deoxy-D-xylulose-5-phosphate reductoisomerase [Clostridia bacterium]|nr:1-deoxy-D-xylulose-5-phosphate reductoisomerase [Clostridia bacterium]
MKTVTILGSTGSIGVQSLDVTDKMGYGIAALAANTDVNTMEKQIRKYRPAVAAMFSEGAARELKIRVADLPVKVLSGREGVCECAVSDCDIVINSIVGMAGLEPTLCTLIKGTDLALANKETLVAGGEIVKKQAALTGAAILPVDSEHSAVFQCLQGMNAKKELKRVILTASGGPFFGRTRKELEEVTVQQALNHPNWSMGAKITVDSASMMNKGLELIEAVHLFDVRSEDVSVVIHRESIVHSMIEYADNSVIAQMGLPDMRIPIQYALTYPERYESPVGQLDLCKIGKLSFYEPDYETFGCINLCRKAIGMGGLHPAAVNSANEEANRLFREGKIRFLQIEQLVSQALYDVPQKDGFTLEDVLEADREVRRLTNERAKKLNN